MKIDDDGLAPAVNSRISHIVRVNHRPTRMITQTPAYPLAGHQSPTGHVPCPNVRKVLVDPFQDALVGR